MDIRQLKSALERIESLYAAAGSTSAAKDLRSVAQLLDGHEEKTVDAFIAETSELLNSASIAKSATVNEERVASHSDRLLAAGVDQSAFDTALAKLDSDPSVGKAEWAAIANRYRNAPTNGTHIYKFKSNKEARAAIRDAFIERHEANSKRGIIDRLTKWAS
jgi:hypothetical protein